MKKYEGMFIFYPAMDDQALEEKIGKVGAEITKFGGKLGGVTRMGRNAFARPMRKKEAGIYVLVNFEMDPAQVDALRKRCKLNDDLLRAQVFLAVERVAPPKPAPEEVAEA